MLKKISLAVFLCIAFTGLCLIPFYPVLPAINRYLYGFPGDPYWSVWFNWWFDYSHFHNLNWRFIPLASFPFGLDYMSSPHYIVQNHIARVLQWLSNDIAARNIMVFFTFPASALTMYLLAKKVTDDAYASFFCGVAYALCPYHTAHALQHVTLSGIQWLPLYVYALLLLDERRTFGAVSLAAVSFALIFLTDFYYVYFTAFLTAVFIGVQLFRDDGFRRARSLVFSLSVVLVIAAAIVIPLNLSILQGIFQVGRKGIVDQQFQRSIGDLLTFSAKPLDYFMPPKYNPFLGRFVPDFGLSPWKGHRLTEHTLYLGVVPLILSAYAIICSIRKGAGEGVRKSGFWFALGLALIAGVVSLPPVVPLGHFTFDAASRALVAEHKLYLPSYFLYLAIPFFRCYARFGLMVMLGVTILAGLGLAGINARLSSPGAKGLLAALLSLLVVAEFLNLPPFMVIDGAKIPAEYLWLRQQPGDDAIVEYPVGDGIDPSTAQEYMFFQRVHHKKLVNGAVPGTEAYLFHDRIMDISKRETQDALKAAGVRYVLIHDDKYREGSRYVQYDWVTAVPRDKIFTPSFMAGEVPVIADGEGLVPVERFENTRIYKIE
jgi:hypothetical protein